MANNEERLFNNFLELFNIQKQEPDFSALEKIVSAFAKRIPFENISKLYYLNKFGQKSIPDFEQYLDGIEKFNFGGTCYSNNYYLHRLLVYLGYECKLCGADMNQPDVHLVNIVTLDGHDYIIDVGYAAPFDHPLPRDLEEKYIIELGRDKYILMPKDRNGNSKMELYRDGKLIHEYLAKPIHRPIEYFQPAITDSYLNESTFMSSLLLAKIFNNRSLVIYNLSIIKSVGSEFSIQPIANRDDLTMAIEKHFLIPRNIASEAIKNLGKLGNAWN